MPDTFHLIDLPSQAVAIQRLLVGRSSASKLAWLASRGRLIPVVTGHPDSRTVYRFESPIGLECAFFIDGDQFVFFGDHPTYTIDR